MNLCDLRYVQSCVATIPSARRESDRVRSLLRSRRLNAALGALVAVGLVCGLVIAGATHGYPAQRENMLSGSAWLASAKVGQLTLLDGTSAEVAAQVQAAPPGDALQVVQQGSAAYAIDQTAGTVRRIDGATFDATAPSSPLPGAHGGLAAFATPGTVYVLDAQHGLLVDTDPETLAPRDKPIPLATQLGDGTAILDSANRLWLIDQTTGDLTWLTGDQRHVVPAVAKPGHSVLTLANGNPVVVDPVAGKASTIDPNTGRVIGTVDLDLRPTDTVQVSGSPHADRVYLVTSRGVLDVCDLGAGTCDQAILLTTAANSLGAAVEAGDRLFVPDYTTGSVWVVDLNSGAIVAQPRVLDPPARFQLINRDGLVFFNDPNSERAGVIRLDGTVVSVAKYDPGNPKAGVHIPGEDGVANIPAAYSSRAGSANRPSADDQPGDQSGAQQPTGVPPVGSPPSSFPTITTSPGAGGNPSGGTQPPITTTTSPPAAALRITLSNGTPTVNQNIALQVTTDSGQPPSQAQWDFGDGQQGTGTSVTHQWAAAQTYQVSVTATMPDGEQASTSVSVVVSTVPKVTLTVSSPTNGTVTGGGISCPGTCAVTVDAGTQITLTAQPDTQHFFKFAGWGGACGGTGDCALTMTADKSVSASFQDMAAGEDCQAYDPNTLAVAPNADGSFRLTDGSRTMDMLDNATDASAALTIAKQTTEQCFIGRDVPSEPSEVMQYWQGGAGHAALSGSSTCTMFNLATLTVVSAGGQFDVTDGSTTLKTFANEPDAVRALRIFQAAQSILVGQPERVGTAECFLGANNQRTPHYEFVFEYFPASNTR